MVTAQSLTAFSKRSCGSYLKVLKVFKLPSETAKALTSFRKAMAMVDTSAPILDAEEVLLPNQSRCPRAHCATTTATAASCDSSDTTTSLETQEVLRAKCT